MNKEQSKATLCAALKGARQSRGHTQRDVARWLGWSRGKVARIEGGNVSRLCVFDVRALCRLYGLNMKQTVESAVSDSQTRQGHASPHNERKRHE